MAAQEVGYNACPLPLDQCVVCQQEILIEASRPAVLASEEGTTAHYHFGCYPGVAELMQERMPSPHRFQSVE